MTVVRTFTKIPLRSQPALFSPNMEDLLTNLPGWTMEVNAVGAEAEANKVIAVDSAALAVQKAMEAYASANAALMANTSTKWVSGQTYTEGVSVWSPVNYLAYRRKATGAGTVDPSIDTTNWDRMVIPVVYVTYDNRGSIRSLIAKDGEITFVESIGLFRWVAGSTEPDDDETCFVTSGGAWLLELPHFDFLDAANSIEEMEQDARIEDVENVQVQAATVLVADAYALLSAAGARMDTAEDTFEAAISEAQDDLEGIDVRVATLEGNWPGRVLHATAACSITSISATSSSSFTVTVAGAAVGDVVIANPPDSLTARVSTFARVTSANTVTVYINNPSSATATIATGSWEIAVIKG